MIGEFSNIKIQGMAAAVPEYVEDNSNFSSILGKRRMKKQMQLTGISKRHISKPHQRVSDLCYASTVQLLERLKWEKDEIKVLVFISQKPNYELPSTAFFLQSRLGLPKDCVCFDMNLGCSSFSVGIHVVSALLQSCGISDKALLLIGDISSQVLDPESSLKKSEVADRMIFGAAGASIALEKIENNKLKFMTKSDGDGFEAIIKHFGRETMMDGGAVFEFAINDVSKDIIAFKEHFGLDDNDIDYYILHQAQKLILDAIADVCAFPEEKELRSLEEFGNTSGTSVPLTVCYNRNKFGDRKNVKFFFCGFGVGLSWGIIYTEIPTENILPVIITDEHYDDDKVSTEKLHDCSILVVGADKPMGESVARFLDKKGAEIILLGTDEKKLWSINDELFENSHIVVSNESNLAMFHSVVQLCHSIDISFDGIVFADNDMDLDIDYNACLLLAKEECLKKDASIVIASNIETEKNTRMDLSTYSMKKENLEVVIQRIQNEINIESIRVNAVLYDETKLDFVQITGSGQEWCEKYLQDGCPAEMKRLLFVGKAICYLMSEESQYTTGVLIPINK